VRSSSRVFHSLIVDGRVAFFESLASLVGNFAGAVAFQKIGWKYFLVFAVWDAFETVVIWLYAVETKGRTLEELDEIFQV